MTSKNEITGDLLKSKASSAEFDRGFSEIDWSIKLGAPEVPASQPVELWSEDDEKRQDIIGQNGPLGLHYVGDGYEQVERDYAV
jgi:hypothetical protein